MQSTTKKNRGKAKQENKLDPWEMGIENQKINIILNRWLRVITDREREEINFKKVC